MKQRNPDRHLRAIVLDMMARPTDPRHPAELAIVAYLQERAVERAHASGVEDERERVRARDAERKRVSRGAPAARVLTLRARVVAWRERLASSLRVPDKDPARHMVRVARVHKVEDELRKLLLELIAKDEALPEIEELIRDLPAPDNWRSWLQPGTPGTSQVIPGAGASPATFTYPPLPSPMDDDLFDLIEEVAHARVQALHTAVVASEAPPPSM